MTLMSLVLGCRGAVFLHRQFTTLSAVQAASLLQQRRKASDGHDHIRVEQFSLIATSSLQSLFWGLVWTRHKGSKSRTRRRTSRGRAQSQHEKKKKQGGRMADLMPGVGDFLSSSQAASRMFSGFKSVCIKSRPCKYATLSSSCRPKSRTTSILNGRY